MRKYIYNVVIILFVLQMSHVQVLANYKKDSIATAQSIETLQSLIFQEVMQFSTEFSIQYTGDLADIKDELTEITKNAIQNDYLYANISSFKWNYNGTNNHLVIDFTFTYHLSQAEEAFVAQTLATITAPMHGFSDIQKLQAAHDFIVLSTEYSKETEGSQYSPYTLLKENKGVCQAYALVLYRMLEMLGFEVRYVPGNAGEQLHAWVLVKLEQDWYHIDVTWDDPLPDRKGEVRYQYFLLSDRQLSRDHTWDYARFPAATSEKYTEMQQLTKTQSGAAPFQYRLHHKLMMDENKLAIKQPTKLVTLKQSEPNEFDMNKWTQINIESLAVFLVTHPIYTAPKISWLTSIDRVEKRMPQEKYVIRKEVSHLIFGTPPFSCY
ncbi:transglutaminase domain-containing protein [Lysinibacillus sp. FSL H8-0500]|uniref:transglutaminase domain-containing protein n=1 Tax=Lysinibacillus sp. FSL H8-0500 TaxID=2921393 RepID=UPI0031019C68